MGYAGEIHTAIGNTVAGKSIFLYYAIVTNK